MNIDELKQKYPNWNIYSNPITDCNGCKGIGEIHLKSGRAQPCLCVCLEDIPEWDKKEFLTDVGNSARKIFKMPV